MGPGHKGKPREGLGDCCLGVVALGGRTGESVKTRLVPTRAPRKEGRSRSSVEVGRASRGPGAQASGQPRFPGLLLCTHAGGGCPLLYSTLSLPPELAKSWPGAGGERGPGSSYKDLATRTSAGLGRVSEPLASPDPAVGREASRGHFRSHGEGPRGRETQPY